MEREECGKWGKRRKERGMKGKEEKEKREDRARKRTMGIRKNNTGDEHWIRRKRKANSHLR